MKILLIPSAILIPKNMRTRMGNLPTALYPLNDVTMLEHIYKKYCNIVDKIIVIGHKNINLIEDYILWKQFPIELIKTDRLEDLGYTIYVGLKNIIKYNPEILYLNFADTFLGEEIINSAYDCAYYSYEDTDEEWTFFEEEDGEIINIIDKVSESSPLQRKMFIGVFIFSDVNLFFRLLTESIVERSSNIDSFYNALDKYNHSKRLTFINSKQWFDVGHIENYYKAKTGVEARSFNSITIDERRGVLKKKSQNVDKFIAEINWYIKIPNNLQYLLPRVYNYSIDRENPYIEMEYYGYHTLHELLIFSDLPLVKWQQIFHKLLFIIEDMQRYTVKAEENDIKRSLEEMYINKTVNRLNLLKKDSRFDIFFKNNIYINGIKFDSLDNYIDKFIELSHKLLIENYNSEFTIIHGDLCFSNILIEENHEFMRIIDPRGTFGNYDIYGDPRYELAKIMHTLEGNYDYIIEDMFVIERKASKINLKIPQQSEKILDVFLDVFKLKNIEEIRLIEASLFLSMIPLHSDYEDRQYAMLATGIQLLEKILENNK